MVKTNSTSFHIFKFIYRLW